MMTTLNRSAVIRQVRAKGGTYVFPLSSEEPYRRSNGIEILDHSEGSVDLSWLNSGNAPLLDTHDRWTGLAAQIGVVRKAWIENKRVYVEVEFSNQAHAQAIKADVDSGIIRNVSVGYEVHKTERDEDSNEYLVTSWTPKEASFVPIPADQTVGMGRSARVKQEGVMPKDQVTPSTQGDGIPPLPGGRTDEERAADFVAAVDEISELASEHNMGDLGRSYVTGAVKQGREPSVAEFKGMLRAKLPDDVPLRNEDIGLTDQETRRFSLHKFILATAPGAKRDDEEAAAFELEAMRSAGDPTASDAMYRLPTDVLRSWGTYESDGMQVRLPMGVGTGAGGNSLQANPNVQTIDHLAERFIDNLRNALVLGQLGVTMLPGLSSNIEIPGGDVNSQAFWLGSEDADVAETTPTFRKIGLNIKTVGNYSDMSRNFLLQSTIAAEAYTRNQLLRAVSEEIDRVGWYGSGAAGQPTGIANTAGIGSVTFAAAVPTRGELIDMDTAVANTNQVVSPSFATNTAMVGDLRKTKVDAGSGVFLMDSNASLEIGNSVARTNQITAGDVFAGVFSDMLMGMWGSLEFGRSTEAKFLSGGIRIRAMTSVDFALARVGSFVLGNDGV